MLKDFLQLLSTGPVTCPPPPENFNHTLGTKKMIYFNEFGIHRCYLYNDHI